MQMAQQEPKSSVQSSVQKRRKTFYASVFVTRVEDWCVDAETAEEARALLANGEGRRCAIGDCVCLEVQDLNE